MSTLLVCSFSDACGRLSFTDSFASGAKCLISQHLAVWMISYARQMIIGGQPLNDYIGNLLHGFSLGKHTSGIYIGKQGGNSSSGGAVFVFWPEHQEI